MLGISKTKHKSAKVGSECLTRINFYAESYRFRIALLSSVNPVYIVFFSLEIAAIKKGL